MPKEGDLRDTTTTKLDPFVVTSYRETEGDRIAMNGQRFAPNLKNVMSTDAFGDIDNGNVGEFLKYMPSIAVQYGNGNVSSVSIRGFDPNTTAVYSRLAFSP